jgi:hypothetical protein
MIIYLNKPYSTYTIWGCRFLSADFGILMNVVGVGRDNSVIVTNVLNASGESTSNSTLPEQQLLTHLLPEQHLPIQPLLE